MRGWRIGWTLLLVVAGCGRDIYDRPEPGDVPRFVEALRSSDVDTQKKATRALSQLGPSVPPAATAAAVNALCDVFKDPATDKYLRNDAAYALGEMGPSAAAAVPVLVERIEDKDEDEDIHTRAGDALIKINPVEASRLGLRVSQ